MTTLRPDDPADDSDLARAERTAAELRNLLARLGRSGIAVGKLVSGWHGQHTLAGDIEVGVEEDAASGEVSMTLTLRSHGGWTNPGKPLVYYREFQDFADALQPEGGVQTFGRRLNGTPLDSERSPVIEFTLSHAGSPKLAERVREMARRADAMASRAALLRQVW